VLFAVAVFAAGSALLCTRVTFDTDVLNLLPQRSPSLQGFRTYLEHFGVADQLYIVFDAPDGRPIDDVSDAIDSYLEGLRQAAEIARVDDGLFDAGKDWSYLRDRTFMLIGPSATRDALRRFEPDGMREALNRSRDLLQTPSPEIRRLVQSDPLGLLSLLRDHFASDRSLAGFMSARSGYISSDGRSRLVIATPTGPPFDSAFCRRLFERLASVEAEVARTTSGGTTVGHPPALRVSYAGGHRIAFETEGLLKKEATLNTVTSLLAILFFLLAIFWSPWLFLVGAIPMAVATLGAVAISGLVHDRLSAAATGTSALLFGLGIDGLVLMYARYLEEIESGHEPASAIGRLAGAGTSMLLGCLTTAATFFGLTWIDLPALQQLGWLVGIGMLLGGPLTLLLVPAMLPNRVPRSRALSLPWLAPFVRRHHRIVLITAGIATVVALPFVPGLDLDLRLQRLQPATPAVQVQGQLPERFGLDQEVGIVVARGEDLDALLTADRALAAAMRKHATAVSGPSQLLPPADEQAETSRALRTLSDDVTTIQGRLRTAASEAGFRAGAIDEFIAALPRVLNPDQRLTYEGYAEHGLRDLVSRFVAPSGPGFATAAYVELPSAGDLAQVSAAVAEANATATLTGIPIVNAMLAAQFRRQFFLGLAAGTAMVFVLILAAFRRIDLTLIAISPTILGLIWAGALLAQLGPSLDLFSIFAVLTLIGIGVDYGIHLVHRAASEPGHLDTALARVAPANLVAAGIALLGCGSLVTSSYPPLKTLGIVASVGLCTCLVTALLVLPALLMAIPLATLENSSRASSGTSGAPRR
jgi:hypothetical protein